MILHRISINTIHPISATSCNKEHTISMCFFKILIGCFCFFHYSSRSDSVIGIKCCLAAFLTHPHISCSNDCKYKWCTVHPCPFMQTKCSFKYSYHTPSLSLTILKSNDLGVEIMAFHSHTLCQRIKPQCYIFLRLSLIEQHRNIR